VQDKQKQNACHADEEAESGSLFRRFDPSFGVWQMSQNALPITVTTGASFVISGSYWRTALPLPSHRSRAMLLGRKNRWQSVRDERIGHYDLNGTG
jgi:hypothetical protein